MSVPPFVEIRGRPYLVANWDLDTPPGPQDWLVLRPLTTAEVGVYVEWREYKEAETWAVMVPTESRRLAG